MALIFELSFSTERLSYWPVMVIERWPLVLVTWWLVGWVLSGVSKNGDGEALCKVVGL